MISETTDFLEVLHYEGDRSAIYKRYKAEASSPAEALEPSQISSGKETSSTAPDTSRSMFLLLLWQTVLRSVDDARKESRAVGTVAAFAVKRFIERASDRKSTPAATCQFTVDHLLP